MNHGMNIAYLLIGGNMGDRLSLLVQASGFIEQACGQIIKRSAVYQTEAWGKTDQPLFLNQVLQIATALSAEQLLERILQIESDMGRKRMEKYGPRLMDIDILLYNDEVIELPGLQVPHPRLAERRFALVPLAEVAPNVVHPVSSITIATMLANCPDPLGVHKL